MEPQVYITDKRETMMVEVGQSLRDHLGPLRQFFEDYLRSRNEGARIVRGGGKVLKGYIVEL